MKTKATKKFLSLALAVVMIMGSAVAMFAYATEGEPTPPATQTTPLAYATAENGALLYTADFTSDNFTVDQALLDSIEYVANPEDAEGPKIPQSAHSVKDEDPETPGVQVPSAFEKEGSIILDSENTENTVANEVVIGGWFNDYSLENATYTVTANVKRTDFNRVAFYFFQGIATGGKNATLMKFYGTTNEDNVTKENNGHLIGVVSNSSNVTSKSSKDRAAGYGNNFGHYLGLSAQGSAYGYGFFGGEYYEKVSAEGVADKYYAKDIEYKYVITGGAKNEDGQIPVTVALYAKKGDSYALVLKEVGLAINNNLWVGMGRWDIFAKDDDGNFSYMELSNVNIYKGDTMNAFGPSFKALYDAAEDGDVLFTINGEGLADPTKAFANGYSWYNHDNAKVVGSTTYEGEGMFLIDNSRVEATAAVPDNPETEEDETKPATYGVANKQGFSTSLPLGTDWHNGVYTFEMTVNSNTRTALHFVNSQSRRLGFVLDGNNGDKTSAGGYTVTTPFSYDGNFKAWTDGNAAYMGTGFDVNQSVVRKDTSVDTGDGTNAANVRIVFDFDQSVVSLYELGATSNKWQKVAGVNFAGKAGKTLGSDLIFSAHCYNKLSLAEISNFKIIKGNAVGEFKFGFASTYDSANWGVKMLELNTMGMTNPTLNGEAGYNWVIRNVAPTVDADGFIYINQATGSGTGTQMGAYTAHPFADEWDTGYYTLSFCLNNASRAKMGLFDVVDANGAVKAARVGFLFIPNMKYTAATEGTPAVGTEGEEGYVPAVPGTPESLVHDTNGEVYVEKGLSGLYFGNADSFSYTAANGITTTVYDTFVADDMTPNPEYNAEVEGSQQYIVDEDTLPDDARIVRMQGGNNPNVRIEFNCVDKIITLFERAGGKWHKISAIDYSGLEEGYKLTPVFDIYAWDWNSNITLKDVEYTKGFLSTHLYSYVAGGVDTGILASDFDQTVVDGVLASYINKYNLGGAEIAWSVDGGKTAVEDFANVYANFNDQVFAPKKVNIVPLVKYAEMAKAVALRGVKFSAVSEDGKYDVNFVAAIKDVDLTAYKTVGFKVTKVTTVEGVVTATALENVETDKVFTKLNSNGSAIDAAAFGGKYVVSAGIKGEAAAEGVQVDYVVTAYVVAQDGTAVEADEAMTFTFIGGEYTPTAPALVIPQA